MIRTRTSVGSPRQKLPVLQSAVRSIVGPYWHEMIKHVLRYGRFPRLAHPVTFNEKVIHRKLFDRDARFPLLADKLIARQLVDEKMGSTRLTRLHFCGATADELDFEALPGSFVMEANYGSGPAFVSLIQDKHSLGESGLRSLARSYLRKKYGQLTNEWWYTQIQPQVMIEELLVDCDFGVPLDYKFYVFHGQTKFVQVDHARFTDHTRTFYDRDWQPQEFTLNYRRGPIIPRPEPFYEMRAMAELLGQALDFVRIDLYCVNGERVVFSEFTLAPGAGWARFVPSGWNEVLGTMW